LGSWEGLFRADGLISATSMTFQHNNKKTSLSWSPRKRRKLVLVRLTLLSRPRINGAPSGGAISTSKTKRNIPPTKIRASKGATGRNGDKSTLPHASTPANKLSIALKSVAHSLSRLGLLHASLQPALALVLHRRGRTAARAAPCCSSPHPAKVRPFAPQQGNSIVAGQAGRISSPAGEESQQKEAIIRPDRSSFKGRSEVNPLALPHSSGTFEFAYSPTYTVHTVEN
jgi:hypothetical protein